ncbi:oligosaccharide repeat unit polymerase [Qipengyuania marisflavi]|nr:oligosaccharide repeat unit polymerase [Qipengyuania marisflavi]
MSLTVLVFCAYNFYRNSRMAGLAVCIVIGIQAFVRPLLFFLGLDVPSPPQFFNPDSWTLVAYASAVAAIWVALLTLSYWAFSSNLPSRGIFPAEPHAATIGQILAVGIAITIINAFATLYLVYEWGGIGRFIYAVKTGKELKGAYVIREIGTTAVGTLAVALIAMGKVQKTALEYRRGLVIISLIIFLILLNFAVNFMWGNRHNIAVLTLAVLMGWHFCISGSKLSRMAWLSVGALAALIGLRWVRSDLTTEAAGITLKNTMPFWRETSYSLHFAQFDGLMLALRDAGERFELRYGQDFVSGLLAWVPRQIYAGRETYMVGGWFRRNYEPDKVNGWTLTQIGDWYVNFSWPGIFLGGLLSGLLAAAIDAAYRDRRISPWAAGIGAVISFRMLDGGFDFGTLQNYVLFVVPFFLVAITLRLMSAFGLGGGAQTPSYQGLPPPVQS